MRLEVVQFHHCPRVLVTNLECADQMSIVVYKLARSKGFLTWRIFENSMTVENISNCEDSQESCQVQNRCDDPVSRLSVRSTVWRLYARIPGAGWTLKKTFSFFWLLQIRHGHSKC